VKKKSKPGSRADRGQPARDRVAGRGHRDDHHDQQQRHVGVRPGRAERQQDRGRAERRQQGSGDRRLIPGQVAGQRPALALAGGGSRRSRTAPAAGAGTKSRPVSASRPAMPATRSEMVISWAAMARKTAARRHRRLGGTSDNSAGAGFTTGEPPAGLVSIAIGNSQSTSPKSRPSPTRLPGAPGADPRPPQDRCQERADQIVRMDVPTPPSSAASQSAHRLRNLGRTSARFRNSGLARRCRLMERGTPGLGYGGTPSPGLYGGKANVTLRLRAARES